MRIRHLKKTSQFMQHMSNENLSLEAIDLTIYKKLERIIYSDTSFSSTKIINDMVFKGKDNNFYHKAKKILNYLTVLSENNKLSIDSLYKLIVSLQDFFVSRNCDIHGRYTKSTYLGFTIVKSTPEFLNFIKSLKEIANQVKTKISVNQNNESFFLTLMRAIKNGLTQLKYNPVSTVIILAYYKSVLVTAQTSANDNRDRSGILLGYGMDDKLVAYYPFNTNAVDATGHGNDGVIYGLKLTDDRFGNKNSAFHFNQQGYIYIPADDFPTEERTITLWFNPKQFHLTDNRDRGGILLGYGGDGCGTSFLMDINNCDGAPPNSYEVQGHCDVNQVLYVDNSMYGSPSVWTQLAVTISYYSGTSIYLNGVLVKSDIDVRMLDTIVKGRQLGIGTGTDPQTGLAPYFTPGAPNWYGDLDDIYFYSRALNATEIKNKFDIEKNPPVTPPTPTPSDDDIDNDIPDIQINAVGVVVGLIPSVITALMSYTMFKIRKCCTTVKNETEEVETMSGMFSEDIKNKVNVSVQNP